MPTTPTKKAPQKPMTEDDMFLLLKKRYPASQYLLLRQVPSGMGAGTKYADVVGLGIWSSRDIRIQGFEIKCSRASWLTELQNPAKAEEVGKYCHQWWIVSSSPLIVDPAELPKNWGLLVNKDDQLEVVVKAPDLMPKPLDTVFLGRLLQRVVDQNSLSASEQDREAAFKSGYEKGLKDAQESESRSTLIDDLVKRLAEKSSLIEKIEDSMGMAFGDLDLPTIKALGEVLRLYRKSEHTRQVDPRKLTDLLDAYYFLHKDPINQVTSKLRRVCSQLNSLHDSITNKLNTLDEFRGEKRPEIRFDRPDSGELPDVP